MVLRLSGQTSVFSSFSLHPSLFGELKDKRNFQNKLRFCSESIGAMLEFCYIERGLLGKDATRSKRKETQQQQQILVQYSDKFMQSIVLYSIVLRRSQLYCIFNLLLCGYNTIQCSA